MPPGVALERWLGTFPSFGYLLAVAPGDVTEVTDKFIARGIAAAEIGAISSGHAIAITDGHTVETIRDFRTAPMILASERELTP